MPRNKTDPLEFRRQLISDYKMSWWEKKRTQNELLDKRDRKGIEYNKSLNNPDPESWAGFSSSRNYKKNLLVSYEEYSDYFKKINEEYEVAYEEAVKKINLQYKCEGLSDQWSVTETLFISLFQPYDPSEVIENVFDVSKTPAQIAAEWQADHIYYKLKNSRQVFNRLEHEGKFQEWKPWKDCIWSFSIKPWDIKFKKCAKVFHAEYMNHLKSIVFDKLDSK